MSQQHDVPLSRKLSAFAVFAAMFGGLSVLVCTCVVDQTELRDAGNAYLEALRAKDYDRAYELVAPQTKAAVSRTAFERAMSTAALSRSTDHSWLNGSASSTGKGCLHGGVVVDDEGESLWMYMWKTETGWTVHTVAYDQADLTGMPWRCD